MQVLLTKINVMSELLFKNTEGDIVQVALKDSLKLTFVVSLNLRH